MAGPGLRTHVGEVLPLIIDSMQGSSASVRRSTAIVTLGQVGLPQFWVALINRQQTLREMPRPQVPHWATHFEGHQCMQDERGPK